MVVWTATALSAFLVLASALVAVLASSKASIFFGNSAFYSDTCIICVHEWALGFLFLPRNEVTERRISCESLLTSFLTKSAMLSKLYVRIVDGRPACETGWATSNESACGLQMFPILNLFACAVLFFFIKFGCRSPLYSSLLQRDSKYRKATNLHVSQ